MDRVTVVTHWLTFGGNQTVTLQFAVCSLRKQTDARARARGTAVTDG